MERSPVKKINRSLDCGGCPNKITDRQYLLCSSCNLTFDLICGNVSTTRFYIMEPEKKAAWKCQACICNKKQTGDNSNTPVGTHHHSNKNANDNVTLRKPKAFSLQISMDDISLLNQSIEDQTFSKDTTTHFNDSNTSMSKNDEMLHLKLEIEELTNQLIKAKEEINKLHTENLALKESLTLNETTPRKNAKKSSKVDNKTTITTTATNKLPLTPLRTSREMDESRQNQQKTASGKVQITTMDLQRTKERRATKERSDISEPSRPLQTSNKNNKKQNKQNVTTSAAEPVKFNT